jgi:hypothetical protein
MPFLGERVPSGKMRICAPLLSASTELVTTVAAENRPASPELM